MFSDNNLTGYGGGVTIIDETAFMDTDAIFKEILPAQEDDDSTGHAAASSTPSEVTIKRPLLIAWKPEMTPFKMPESTTEILQQIEWFDRENERTPRSRYIYICYDEIAFMDTDAIIKGIIPVEEDKHCPLVKTVRLGTPCDDCLSKHTLCTHVEKCPLCDEKKQQAEI